MAERSTFRSSLRTEPYRTGRRFCPHCKKSVATKTYKTHKRLYFNSETNTWLETENANAMLESIPDSSIDDEPSPPSSNITGMLVDDQENALSQEEPPCDLYNLTSDEDLVSEPDDQPSEEEWLDNDPHLDDTTGDSADESEPECTFTENTLSTRLSVLCRWLIVYLLTLQTVFHLSDQAIAHLLRFLKLFFRVMGKVSPPCNVISELLPASLYMAKKLIDNKRELKQYVVCPKCHRLYFLSDCRRDNHCSFQRFPHHPHIRMRKACGSKLTKRVKLSSGKQICYPLRTYCYVSLKESIKKLFSFPSFCKQIEHWRSRKSEEGIYKDVYDGRVWKDFMYYDDQPFLADNYNLALILNADFFQPFKHVSYSVGVIYAVVLNLPRHLRYKRENVIIIGVLPGPDEPKHDLNSYLEPLTDELLELWSGVEMNTAINGTQNVRCAVVCIACDLPAGRKLCGFLGHSARYGCSRCYKAFSGSVGTMDYSGFNTASWPKRTGDNHRSTAMTLNCFRTLAEQESKESAEGCRYSELLRLPYFNAPRMLIVDPMHNLFLGTAKHFVKSVLIERGLLTDPMFDKIQERINSTRVPTGIGRIPYKIRSGFAAFTADQWKNWVIYYSLLVISDMLSGDHLECWRHFVLACRLLTSKHISSTQLQLSNALLLQFCRRSQRLYGNDFVTPNMHMHIHLQACIKDYGPSHSFWLFAFERYNGILGNTPNNNRSVEVQLLNRFLHDNSVLCADTPAEFRNDFQAEFDHINATHTAVGSLADTFHFSMETEIENNSWEAPADLVFSSSRSIYFIGPSLLFQLKFLISKLYHTSLESIKLPNSCWRHLSVNIFGKVLGSYKSRSISSSFVMALWKTELFGLPYVSDVDFVEENLGSTAPSELLRLARIECILNYQATIEEKVCSHALVQLSWFKFHKKMFKIGKPVTVWNYDLFEDDGVYTIIPIQFIRSRAVSLCIEVDSETVLAATSCVDF